MDKVGNFFEEVAQLAVLTKQYLVGAYHLLPPQRPPANVVVTPSSKMMGDLTPTQSTGPDIAEDAQTAALVRVIALPQILPLPVRSEGGSWRRQHHEFLVASHLLQGLHRHRRFSLQNCVLIKLIVIHYAALLCILPWIVIPIRHAVSFHQACIMSVPQAESPDWH